MSTLVASSPTREGRAGALASLTSVSIHAGVVALLVWGTASIGQAGESGDVVREIFVMPEPVPPPPPPPLPATTVPEPAAPAPDVTIGSITITAPTIIAPDIPLPSAGSVFNPADYTGIGPEGRADGNTERVVTAEDTDVAPIITPMTVRPSIRNRDEVGRALQRAYPALQRDAGIGGTVVVWIRIDAEGNVVRTQLHESSGNAALDEAALRVGEIIEFNPAMNRDRRIPVWIQWPITFRPM